MTCPQNHKIIIREAFHKVTKTGPCPNDTTDACTLSNVTNSVSKECQNKNTCTVSMSDSSTVCTGYSGNKFVTVRYKCEPGRQSCPFCQVTCESESESEIHLFEPHSTVYYTK